MNNKSQNGSVILIATLISVVALIGILGFVFWQNQKSTDDVAGQNNAESGSNLSIKFKTARIDDKFPVGLSWTYPEDWTVRSEGGGPGQLSDMADQKFTLTSPSGNYEVLYHVGWNGGIGGSCEPSDDILRSIQRTPVGGFGKSILAEVIHGTTVTHGLTYISGLFSNDDNVQQATAGDSFCKIYMRNAIPMTDDGKMIVGAEVNKVQLDSPDSSGKYVKYSLSAETIERIYEDPEYRTAIKILLSTVVE